MTPLIITTILGILFLVLGIILAATTAQGASGTFSTVLGTFLISTALFCYMQDIAKEQTIKETLQWASTHENPWTYKLNKTFQDSSLVKVDTVFILKTKTK